MIKRLLLVLPLLIGLCGCDSLVHKDSDWFEIAGHPPDQVERDDQSCRAAASDYVAYGVGGQDGSFYAGNRAYNGFYSRCMAARHYQSRPYYKNWF